MQCLTIDTRTFWGHPFWATYLEDHPTYFDLFWLVIPVLLILPMGFITIKPPFGSIWENFCGTFSKDRRSTAKLGSCLKASCRSFRSTVPNKTCGTTLAVHVKPRRTPPYKSIIFPKKTYKYLLKSVLDVLDP